MLLKLAYVANGLVFRIPPLLRRFGQVFGEEQFAHRFVEEAGRIRSRTIRRAGIQVVDFEKPVGLEALSLPVVAVAGGNEPEAIRRAPEQLSHMLADVEPVVLEGRDHVWPVKEPALYAQMLKSFLTRIAA